MDGALASGAMAPLALAALVVAAVIAAWQLALLRSERRRVRATQVELQEAGREISRLDRHIEQLQRRIDSDGPRSDARGERIGATGDAAGAHSADGASEVSDAAPSPDPNSGSVGSPLPSARAQDRSAGEATREERDADLDARERALAARRSELERSTLRVATLELNLRERMRRLQEEWLMQDNARRAGKDDAMLICPWCWRVYRPDEVKHKRTIELPGITDHLTSKLGDTLVEYNEVCDVLAQEGIGQALRHTDRFVDMSIPELIERFYQPICPNSEQETTIGAVGASHPFTVLLKKSSCRSMPIIGMPASGKTVLFTTMIAELAELLDKKPEYDLRHADPDSLRQYRKLYKQLYVDGEVRKTEPSEPINIRYTISPVGDGSRALTLYFRDVAGESWQEFLTNPEMSAVSYLENSSALVVLIDPLRNATLSDAVKETIESKREIFGEAKEIETWEKGVDHAGDVLQLIADFKDMAGYRAGDIIEKPCFVVVTKADLMPQTFPLAELENRDAFDGLPPLEHVAMLNYDTRIRVRNHKHISSVVSALEREFKLVLCFAVSALGHTPPEGTLDMSSGRQVAINPDDIKPLGVVDPIVWALWLDGLERMQSHE